MKGRLLLVLASVLLATSVFAVDIPTPTGFTAWYSYDITVTGDQKVKVPADTIEPWQTIIMVVVASNPNLYGETSDESDEILIVGPNWNMALQPPGWSGDYMKKSGSVFLDANGNELSVAWTGATGVVSRYSLYQKQRTIYGSCGKAGKPSFVE